MTKRNRQSITDARWAKKEATGSRMEVKPEKFQEERHRSVKPLIAQNENQKKTLKAFTNKQLIIQTGSAGVGKTELACWWASKLYLEGQIDSIVITRPHKHLGDDYGAIRGGDAEKLLPFCLSMLKKLKKYLGVGILRSDFRMDGFDDLFAEVSGISIVPVEKIQGLSFDQKTLIIADELQNMTVAQVKALTTRMEEGCQLLCCGDPLQTAIKGENGLNYLEKVIEHNPHNDIEIISYTPEDNCRKGVTAHLTKAYEKEGQW